MRLLWLTIKAEMEVEVPGSSAYVIQLMGIEASVNALLVTCARRGVKGDRRLTMFLACSTHSDCTPDHA